ncbi:15705_t:CDS:2 [Funneliformis caledonium]|uniref:15705_t:CDS:1 n=1 Tax=Funneliformis caledonium TaxID=1117310 RepID=A0A9N8WMQ2_9GLOM|nr:15705_t:CDS:2 [Funneliformis caledonium]
MSNINTTPPLVNLNKINTVPEVEIRLHEPLIMKPKSRKKRIGLHVLNALARLEVLLSKEEMLASSETGVQNLKQFLESIFLTGNVLMWIAERYLQMLGNSTGQQYNKTEIENTIAALELSILQFEEDGLAKKDIQTYLKELGLTLLFPKSAKRLIVPNLASGKIDALAHFHEMNQCLNQAGGHFIKYKSRVELHFDAIKSLTNGLEQPRLSPEQKECGRPVTAMSQPLAAYLNNISEVAPK